MKSMRQFAAFVLGAALAGGTAFAAAQPQAEQDQTTTHHSTAGQDMRNAGRSTRNAARDTGRATKKGSKKAWRKTKHGTKKGWNKTKNATKGAVRGGKEGAQNPH